jgi:hypothetical protein
MAGTLLLEDLQRSKEDELRDHLNNLLAPPPSRLQQLNEELAPSPPAVAPSPVDAGAASPVLGSMTAATAVQPAPVPLVSAPAGGNTVVTELTNHVNDVASGGIQVIGQGVTNLRQGAQNVVQGAQDTFKELSDHVTSLLQPAPAPEPAAAVERGGDLRAYARQAATRAGIDPDLFERQIQRESGFTPTAVSPAGARGIAQFMPGTAAGLKLDPSDPYASLDAAAKLDADNLRTYGGDWSKALAAYNAGGGAVARYGGVPPFAETQTYVREILNNEGVARIPDQVLASRGGAQTAATAPSTTGATYRDISQFGDPQLTTDEAYTACGPAAAVRFAQRFGRNPTLREAVDLAKDVGWTAQQGMAGIASEQRLLERMGIKTKLVSGPDWGTFANEARTGNPVVISTRGHYFTADNWDPATNRFHVGRSGLDLQGGKEWMTPQEMTQLMGEVQGGLLADSPAVPTQSTTTAAPSAFTSPDTTTTTPSPLQVVGDVAQNVVQGAQQAVQAVGTGVSNLAQQGLTVIDTAIDSAVASPGGGLPASAQPTPSDVLTRPTLRTGEAAQPPPVIPPPLEGPAILPSLGQARDRILAGDTQGALDALDQARDAVVSSPVGQAVSGAAGAAGDVFSNLGTQAQNLTSGFTAPPAGLPASAQPTPSDVLTRPTVRTGEAAQPPPSPPPAQPTVFESPPAQAAAYVAKTVLTPDGFAETLRDIGNGPLGDLWRSVPSALDAAQTVAELEHKYGGGVQVDDQGHLRYHALNTEQMSPEDREAWTTAVMAVGGLASPIRSGQPGRVPPTVTPASVARVAGAVAGGAAAQVTAPEDISVPDRILRIAAGATVGAAAPGVIRAATKRPGVSYSDLSKLQMPPTPLAAPSPVLPGPRLLPRLPGRLDKISEVLTARNISTFTKENLLSGPAGHFGNIVTQAVEMARQPVIRAAAGYEDEAVAGVRAASAAQPAGLKAFAQVMRTGDTINPETGQTRHVAVWNPFLRLLAATDEYFKTVGSGMGMGMEAQRLIREGKVAAQDVPKVLAQNRDRVVAAGTELGRLSVFGPEAGRTGWGQQLAHLKEDLLNDPNRGKQILGMLIDAAIPFASVPERIYALGLSRVPVIQEATNLIAAGRGIAAHDPRAVQLATGALAVGSMINSAIISNALAGNITGPDDPEHPWSIRLNGEWVDYRQWGAYAAPIAWTAAVVDGVKHEQNQVNPDYFSAIGDRVLQSYVNEQYAGSLIKLLAQVSSGAGVGAVGQFAQSYLDRYLPEGGLLNFLNASTDPLLREPTKNMPAALYERQAARIPGLSELLQPQLSTTSGEPVENARRGIGALLRAERREFDDVGKELARLDRIGYSVASPKPDKDSITLSGSEIPLSEGERRIYNRARGQILGNSTTYMSSDDYRGMSDSAKAQYWSRVLNRAADAGSAAVNMSFSDQERARRIAAGHRETGLLVPRPAP